ncbi:MAG: CRISPR-associated family protein [Hydrocarboniphaga sp.]|uniref:type I-E CRISPR-associated protein Cas7/Cse4/CasC n=1 Tax=Hydrocarboniphaga sp. TaxID=2033016 RepID=UPI0026095096|nr:type I-E CRISPR-associated protein Cas7/Cse4/CasC [Hydrocarboniphaga sp.]MDB5969446.1 CRISPR-associated family protein [Hydrocarboniphaga sp.]
MTQFIQLHLLTSYPPSNLNRDDLGRPKSCIIGGASRLRVSSQSLKRAWRMSEVFESALGAHRGTRTKTLGRELLPRLIGAGVDEKKATTWLGAIVKQFGKPEAADPLKTGQLFHLSPEERAAVERLVALLAVEQRAPSEDELKLLRRDNKAVDIALFGRMLADVPVFNIEAAVQVAHAFTVHKVQIEDDYFTAVDDLNKGEVDAGAGHLGETGFGAGVFYLYLCIDRDLLQQNLQGDAALTAKTLYALLECAATVAPTGKQNSFASRAHALYCLAEKGPQQPRSLSLAFTRPVFDARDGDVQAQAITELNRLVANMDQVYGPRCEGRKSFNVLTGEGSLREMQDFITE